MPLTKDWETLDRLFNLCWRRRGDGIGSATIDVCVSIKSTGISEICSVPLTVGGPVYRKRTAEVDLAKSGIYYWTDGILLGRMDLSKSADELPSIPRSGKPPFVRNTFPSAPGDARTSTVIRESLELIASDGTLVGTRSRLAALILEIAKGTYVSSEGMYSREAIREDELLRLTCALTLADVWNQHLVIEPAAGFDLELRTVVANIRRKFRQAVDYDWVVPRTTVSEVTYRNQMIANATEALKQIVAISLRPNDETARFKTFRALLDEYQIVGVLSVDPFSKAQQFDRLAAPASYELLLPIRRADDKFDLVPINPSALSNTLSATQSPHAPIIVLSQPHQ